MTNAMALVVVLALAPGCNLFENVDEERAPMRLDMASDMSMQSDGLDTQDVSWLDTDIPTDGSASDVDAEANGDMGTSCECIDSSATCIEQRCFADTACDPTQSDGCPQDYACNSEGQCQCANESVCGVRCQSNDECPGEFFCLAAEGYCIQEKRCLSDQTCVDGTRCVYKNSFDGAGTCQRTGTKGELSPCANDLECASASCIDGACARSCRAQIDCNQDRDEACLENFFGMQSYCSTNHTCSCDPGEFCDTDACDTDTFCVAGACSLNEVCRVGQNHRCERGLPCESNEYAFVESGAGTRIYCIDPVDQCFSDAECDPSEACMMLSSFSIELYDSPTAVDFARAVNVCARVGQ